MSNPARYAHRALLTIALTVSATACGRPGRLASGASNTPNSVPWSISTSCDGPDKVWVSYEDLGENGIELGGIAVIANHKDCIK